MCINFKVKLTTVKPSVQGGTKTKNSIDEAQSIKATPIDTGKTKVL